MNKPPYPHPIIAREGWPFLAGIVLVSIVVSFWSVAASIPLWLLSIFVLQFFRDPARIAPEGDLNVLSRWKKSVTPMPTAMPLKSAYS
jgi:phosphatidylserine decarboxylase